MPLIIKLPGNNSTHKLQNAFITGYDLVPTFFDYGNSTYPDTYKGIKIEPLNGKSIRPLLEQKVDKIHGDNETIPMEYFRSEAVVKGNWKALNLQVTRRR